MNPEDNYLELNRVLWNKKLESHLDSAFYDQNQFLKGKSSLNSIELDLLGDVENQSILHLQCHFGQDSMSLSRMGANVTGVDLSDMSIKKATEISQSLGLTTQFICSDVYELPQHHHDKYDIVFTSYGTIGWLPDMDKWAQVISHFLKPGGKLFFIEFHPVIWMFDESFKTVKYNYFNAEPIIEIEKGTYANPDADIEQKSVSWNHSLSEVTNALINSGLTILQLEEYDYSPYPCFSFVKEAEPGKYRIEDLGNKVPMVYSIVAEKI